MATATSTVQPFSNLNWTKFEAITQTAYTNAIPLMEAALRTLRAERETLEVEIARHKTAEKCPEFLASVQERVTGLFAACNTRPFDEIEFAVKDAIETYKFNKTLFNDDVMRVIKATSAKGGEIFETLIKETATFAASCDSKLTEIAAAKTQYVDIFNECVHKKEGLLATIAAASPKKEEVTAAAAPAPGLVSRCLTGIGTAAAAPVRLVRWLGGGSSVPDTADEAFIATSAPPASTAAAVPAACIEASSLAAGLASFPSSATAALSSPSIPAAGSPVAAPFTPALV